MRPAHHICPLLSLGRLKKSLLVLYVKAFRAPCDKGTLLRYPLLIACVKFVADWHVKRMEIISWKTVGPLCYESSTYPGKFPSVVLL